MAIQNQQAANAGVDGLTVQLNGIREVQALFKQLPKQLNNKQKDKEWAKMWKKVTKPLVQEAQNKAPELGDSKNVRKKTIEQGVKYPSNKSVTIKKGQLKKSIGWFRTKASRKMGMGSGYIGPRVKGTYRKEKGGYYGAWVHYGSEVKHFGQFTSKDIPYMAEAFKMKGGSVMASAFPEAEKIVKRAMKKFGLK